MKKFIFLKGPNIDIGLLILRILIGIMMIIHGSLKYIGGSETMTKVGSAASHLGIDTGHTLLGYMAASMEVLGGIMILLGLFFTPGALMLVMVLAVAAFMKISTEAPFSSFSHPLEMGFVFLSLMFIGPGKYSFDHKIKEINTDRNSNIK